MTQRPPRTATPDAASRSGPGSEPASGSGPERATLGRRERKRADTRSRLRQAGLELFVSQGVAATTVRDIADRADVGERTFYRYFDSKEHLLLDDVSRYFDAAAAFVAARPASEPPMASLLAAVGALAEEWDVGDDQVVWLAALVTDDPATRGHLHRLVDEYQEALSQLFAARRGMAEADYRCHLEAAVAGTAFIQAIGRFLVSDAVTIEQYGVEAIRFFAAGCDPDAVAGIDPLGV